MYEYENSVFVCVSVMSVKFEVERKWNMFKKKPFVENGVRLIHIFFRDLLSFCKKLQE